MGGGARILLEITAGPSGNPFIDAWAIWDAGWYLSIAENGYSADATARGQASYAFFPLYPWLITSVGMYIQNNVIAGLLISNVAFIAACVALYRWILIDHEEKLAQTVLVTFILFPGSFIFTAVMSEGLFGIATLMSLYLARKERFALAALCALAAVLTRSMGVFIGVALAYEIYRKHKTLFTTQILWLLLLPLGWVIVGLINHNLTGDPFAWIQIQKEAWQHLTTFPLAVIWEGFFTPEEPAFAFNALYTCIVGLFIIASFKLVRLGDYALALIFFFVPLCSGIVTLYSMVRYSVVAFPLYVFIGYWIYRKPILKAPALAIGIFLQLLFMVLWTTGSYYII